MAAVTTRAGAAGRTRTKKVRSNLRLGGQAPEEKEQEVVWEERRGMGEEEEGGARSAKEKEKEGWLVPHLSRAMPRSRTSSPYSTQFSKWACYVLGNPCRYYFACAWFPFESISFFPPPFSSQFPTIKLLADIEDGLGVAILPSMQCAYAGGRVGGSLDMSSNNLALSPIPRTLCATIRSTHRPLPSSSAPGTSSGASTYRVASHPGSETLYCVTSAVAAAGAAPGVAVVATAVGSAAFKGVSHAIRNAATHPACSSCNVVGGPEAGSVGEVEIGDDARAQSRSSGRADERRVGGAWK